MGLIGQKLARTIVLKISSLLRFLFYPLTGKYNKEMTEKSESIEQASIEEFLRVTVWEERVRIKITVDYYGFIAQKRTRWTRLVQGISLLSSSSAIYSACSTWSKATIILAVISAVASAISISSGWQAESVRFLEAQKNARRLESNWDDLWLMVNTEEIDEKEIVGKIDLLRKAYAEIEQHTQPHYQNKRLAKKIQKRIEAGLNV